MSDPEDVINTTNPYDLHRIIAEKQVTIRRLENALAHTKERLQRSHEMILSRESDLNDALNGNDRLRDRIAEMRRLIHVLTEDD